MTDSASECAKPAVVHRPRAGAVEPDGSNGDDRAVLALYHNTRHASPRHARLELPPGRPLRSPWLARFDWVLDAALDAQPARFDDLVLTCHKERPDTVFVKAGRLGSFRHHVLDSLAAPVSLYVGNGNLPLSKYAQDVQWLLGHPQIRTFFCEMKDLDIPRIRAMPVGLHPVDLLRDDGGLRLQALATLDGRRRKRHKVLVPPARLFPGLGGVPAGPWDRLIERASEPERPAWWQRLAEHRFMLAGWSNALDSPAIMEALALGVIPILGPGPAFEAYDGLPVVRIRDLGELTRERLDRWWDQLAGDFVDSTVCAPDYWWARVAETLPKRAFLVLGAESNGNHLVTDLLVHAGCHGGSGQHPPWDGQWQEGIDDRQPWDLAPPTDQDPIVWRRSVPHLGAWPDIRTMVAGLRERGYRVHALVVHRERHAAVRSQLKWRHVTDPDRARGNIDRAYPYIFRHLHAATVPSTLVGYESLVANSDAQACLLREIGLEPPPAPLPTWDANRKWHERGQDRAGQGPAQDQTLPRSEPRASDRGPLPDPALAAFPEHRYRCPIPVWQAYERDLHRGRIRMRDLRVLFCGLARDCAWALPAMAARIERAGALIGQYQVLVIENDSEDGTDDWLRGWAKRNPRVTVQSERLGTRPWGQVRDPQRMHQLAACRNRYLDWIQRHGDDLDYVAVLDFDLPLGFSYDGLCHSFGQDDWDLMAGHSRSVVEIEGQGLVARYFDAWAFRWPGDSTARPFDEINRLRFLRGEPPVRVWSAFGGLALYRTGALRCGARYGGEDCEHVVLHQGLRERGFDRLFMSPNQIVLYGGEPK